MNKHTGAEQECRIPSAVEDALEDVARLMEIREKHDEARAIRSRRFPAKAKSGLMSLATELHELAAFVAGFGPVPFSVADLAGEYHPKTSPAEKREKAEAGVERAIERIARKAAKASL